ncbi:MAG TPA: phosphoribosyltransferase family protein [Acidobacteriota bacterium]|jgi:putative phosphoribosyl transferase
MQFKNRSEAGRLLSNRLLAYAHHPNVVVLALPPGGAPVAFEVARALNAPMDVFMVRKLAVPSCEGLIFGAIATGGARVLNDVVQYFHIPQSVVQLVTAREQQELERCERACRGDRTEPELKGKTVILVDDGLASSSTLRAAVIALRSRRPATIVVAAPVSTAETCDELRDEVDQFVSVLKPVPFGVERWYEELPEISDEDVRSLLERAAHEQIEPSVVS